MNVILLSKQGGVSQCFIRFYFLVTHATCLNVEVGKKYILDFNVKCFICSRTVIVCNERQNYSEKVVCVYIYIILFGLKSSIFVPSKCLALLESTEYSLTGKI